MAGVLRIATSLQVSQFYLAPMVPEIRRLYPDLELQFFRRSAGWSVPPVHVWTHMARLHEVFTKVVRCRA